MKRNLSRMAALNQKKMILEHQNHLNYGVVENHDTNAARRVTLEHREETRKCFFKPKGHVPDKSAFELAVEKRIINKQ